jgi:hypothetical protein
MTVSRVIHYPDGRVEMLPPWGTMEGESDDLDASHTRRRVDPDRRSGGLVSAPRSANALPLSGGLPGSDGLSRELNQGAAEIESA